LSIDFAEFYKNGVHIMKSYTLKHIALIFCMTITNYCFAADYCIRELSFKTKILNAPALLPFGLIKQTYTGVPLSMLDKMQLAAAAICKESLVARVVTRPVGTYYEKSQLPYKEIRWVYDPVEQAIFDGTINIMDVEVLVSVSCGEVSEAANDCPYY
jgi:hypothetical protein